MVIKTLIALTAVASLSACSSVYKPVNMLTDEYCASSEAKQLVIREEVKKGTFPHYWPPVQCYGQLSENEPKVTQSE